MMTLIKQFRSGIAAQPGKHARHGRGQPARAGFGASGYGVPPSGGKARATTLTGRIFSPTGDATVRPAKAGIPCPEVTGSVWSKSLASVQVGVSAAFSIIEIMVTIALLGVIVLGLVAMFDQTRKALVGSLTQSGGGQDVRATMEMIRQDLEQMVPTYAYNPNPLAFGSVPSSYAVNFWVFNDVNVYRPMVQPLADPNEVRTNVLQEMFFVTRTSPNNNQKWNAIGYKIDMNGESGGVGTLYRYFVQGTSITNPLVASASSLSLSNQMPIFAGTDPATATNYYRVMDGVAHFRIRAFDTNGILITNTLYAGANNTAPNIFATPNRNVFGMQNDNGYTYLYNFVSNAVPAFVEVELGVLDDQTYQKYLALTNAGPAAAFNYLTSHAGQLRIYRQRVRIQAVDSNAYP